MMKGNDFPLGPFEDYPGNPILVPSKDLLQWRKHGPVLEARKGAWDSGQLKAGVIVPEEIGGKYIMYFMGEAKPWVSAIGIAYSHDLYYYGAADRLVCMASYEEGE
ncbi:MAG: hypothetical protein V3W17_05315 [Desulfobacteria bacterium]